MKTSNSNRFLSTFNKVVVGTAILGSLGVGSYFIYAAISKKEVDAGETFKADISVKPFAFSDLKINESHNGHPYLGEAGINALVTRMKEELGYGPEIVGLNSINLTEGGGHISNKDNGAFYASTRSIFINTTNMRLSVPIHAPLADRVETVFQTVYHEYGHYISSSYIENNKPGTTAVADIYRAGVKQNWSNYFVSRFKHMLHYDVDTPLYPYAHPVIKDYKGKMSSYDMPVPDKYLDKSLTLLPSMYNVKQLFDISNSPKGHFDKDMSHVVISGRVPAYTLEATEASSIKYLYSMEELYTRKYMQIGYRLYQSSIHDNGWVRQGAGSIATTFMMDVLRYQPQIDRTGPLHISHNWSYYPDSPYGHDNQYNDTIGEARHMWELMLKEFGQSDGADIAYITSANKSENTDNGGYIQKGDSRLIKFGGFVNHGSNYNYVGYFDSAHKFHSYPITTSDFKYSYKGSLGGQVLHKPTGENDFYVLNDYVKADEVVGKQLFFSTDKDGVHSTAMTSTRDHNVGETSSYNGVAPQILRDNVYKAQALNGKVYIRRESWR